MPGAGETAAVTWGIGVSDTEAVQPRDVARAMHAAKKEIFTAQILEVE